MENINIITKDDRPLFSLTVAEFEELLAKHKEVYLSPVTVEKVQSKLLKGVKELADFLGTSVSTAQRLKSTGLLIPATIQSGRTCLFDSDKVLQLLQSRTAVLHYKKSKK